MTPCKAIILGAAGRDFHNFNVFFRHNPACRVVAFTATQIPYIQHRTYPAALAGARTGCKSTVARVRFEARDVSRPALRDLLWRKLRKAMKP